MSLLKQKTKYDSACSEDAAERKLTFRCNSVYTRNLSHLGNCLSEREKCDH